MEGSSGKIPGLISVKVQTGGLSGSIADLMLDMSFTDETAFKNYSVNPLHIPRHKKSPSLYTGKALFELRGIKYSVLLN